MTTFRNSVGPFKYFTGIESLAQIATREDRVCVLNILGGESSEVTPVGHAYSGGNVVCGTSPGRRGQALETPAGNIPVYNNVREALEDGHVFNCGEGFKDKPVNRDPREVFIGELMRKRAEHNVFHEFYRALVQKLYDEGVSRNVYWVNVDAVIAALLLKIVWPAYRAGTIRSDALETAAFTVFLYSRMLGCAAEIDVHLNRGRNMDTRAAASACRFVA